MKRNRLEMASSAALFCVPMLLLAAAPAIQRAVAQRQAAQASQAAAEKQKAAAQRQKAEEEKMQRGLYGNTPLALAIWKGDSEGVGRLLRGGANLHFATDSHGAYPSALAFVRAEIQLRRERGISAGEYPEIFTLLADAGARE